MEQIQRLKVQGWSNPRFGRIQNDRILFEVMWLGCACDTCRSRLNAVCNRMKTADVKSWRTLKVGIPQRFPIPSVVLEIEPKEMPAQMDVYLSELLGLRISAS